MPMDDARHGALEPPMDEAEASPAASILIVDDDPSQRFLMREALEHKGFEVIEAADGVEGCQLYEEHRPDLLLVDLMMPRMDGYELCRELRRHARSVNVPIVMATARDDIASIVGAYEAGATDFVPKPINWLVLGHRLRYILRASRAFADLQQNPERSSAAEEEAAAAATATDGSQLEPVAEGDEPRTPPNALIGCSGMISDSTFGRLSDKATLSLEWIELDAIVKQISGLQAQRSVAKALGKTARLNALADELHAALVVRDRLISQIGSGIGT
jgi:CheY-like chemotaxis protein